MYITFVMNLQWRFNAEANAVVLLCLLWTFAECQSCSFPAYLSARPRWESKVSLQRQVIGEFWSFNSLTAQSIDATSPERTSTTYHCHTMINDDRYLVTIDKKDTLGAAEEGITYSCLQFIQRSENIIQLKRSTNLLSTQSNHDDFDYSICDESKLLLEPYLLVWPQPDQFYAAPEILQGGFEFTMKEISSQETLCASASLLPHIEIDCMPDEGILVEFRQFQCRGRLEMQVSEKLYILGSWIQGEDIFAVVTNRDELWPKLWMMKSPRTPTNPNHFKIELITSVAILDEDDYDIFTERYVVELKRSSYEQLCDDEARSCDQCDSSVGSSQLRCQRSCLSYECQRAAALPPCTFSASTRGEWLEQLHDSPRTIEVSESQLIADGERPRGCLELKTELWFQNNEMQTLITTFDNGCKTRFSCIEFMPRSQSVIQYRMSDTSIWPLPLPLQPSEICSPDKFKQKLTDTHSNQKNRNNSHRWRTLVKSLAGISDGGDHPKVSCVFKNRIFVVSHSPDGQRSCTGQIDGCQGDGKILTYSEDSCNAANTLQLEGQHECLATFLNERQDRVIITAFQSYKDGQNDRKYSCWLFHKNEWETEMTLYVAPAGECHEYLPEDIAYYNSTNYWARFDIIPGERQYGLRDCHTGNEVVGKIEVEENEVVDKKDGKNRSSSLYSSLYGGLLMIASISAYLSQYLVKY